MIGRALAAALLGFVALYLLAPLVVVVGASFSGAETGGQLISYVQFPPQHLTLGWYGAIPAETYQSLALSIGLAAAAALGACLLGVPAALGLVRGRMPGKVVVEAIFRAPLQIPAVVTGIASWLPSSGRSTCFPPSCSAPAAACVCWIDTLLCHQPHRVLR